MIEIIRDQNFYHYFDLCNHGTLRVPKKYNQLMIDTDILLAAGATYKKMKAGEIIFKEGTRGNFYYQLVSGQVRWVNIDEYGKEFIQYIVEPGDSFGELPMFDDKPYAATSIAEKDSIVIRLHRSSFIKLLAENPAIHFSFSAMMSQRIRFKLSMLKELAQSSPKNRIIALLTYFKESKRNICTKCDLLKLTRQQLADMTGLRVETVIRVMKQLVETGKVRIEKGKVYLQL